MIIPRWLRIGSWIAVFLWATGITILSSLSGPQIEEINPFEIWDKAAHFIAFAVGAILLLFALRWNTKWTWRKIVLVSILSISVFGALDEYHQLYTPKRSGADPADWLADTLGAAAGASATRFIYVRYQRKNRTSPTGA